MGGDEALVCRINEAALVTHQVAGCMVRADWLEPFEGNWVERGELCGRAVAVGLMVILYRLFCSQKFDLQTIEDSRAGQAAVCNLRGQIKTMLSGLKSQCVEGNVYSFLCFGYFALRAGRRRTRPRILM